MIKWYAPLDGIEDDFKPLDYRLVDEGDELLLFPPAGSPYKVIAGKFVWDEEQHLLCLELKDNVTTPFVERYFKELK